MEGTMPHPSGWGRREVDGRARRQGSTTPRPEGRGIWKARCPILQGGVGEKSMAGLEGKDRQNPGRQAGAYGRADAPPLREGGGSVAAERGGLGRRALALDVDVTDPAQVRSMVERTRAELGRIDVLVNNAGLALVSGRKSLWEMDDEEGYREIDVNLNGVYPCCKAVAAALVEQGEGGKIINISSLAGRQAQPQYGGYTPAKFAVIGLTQMLAKELAPHGVNVNAVCPGSPDTDMMGGTFRRTGERLGVPFAMG